MDFQPDSTQLAKAQAFKKLHERDGIFVVPNPWDAGSAKMLQSIGFEALATTSAGLAFSLGKSDGDCSVMLEDAFDKCAEHCFGNRYPCFCGP